MSPDQVAFVTGLLQLVIALVTLIVTVLVTVLVFLGTRRIARIEHDRGVREAWNAIDAVILSDPALLATAESLLPEPFLAGTIEGARRKWLAFMLLNTLSSTFNAARFGVVRSGPDSLATCEYHLAQLVRHDDIFALTQSGYSQGFADFCKEVRERLAQ